MTHKAAPVRYVAVEPVPAAQVVDLINEFSTFARLAAGEAEDPYPDLDWLAVPGMTRDHLVAVANLLYPAFSDPSTTVQILNELADRIGIRHRLDGAAHLTWTRPNDSSQALATATVSLIDLVANHARIELGTCAGARCVDVYVDQSQAQNRTYCSERCNNRARATRWRARQQN